MNQSDHVSVGEQSLMSEQYTDYVLHIADDDDDDDDNDDINDDDDVDYDYDYYDGTNGNYVLFDDL